MVSTLTYSVLAGIFTAHIQCGLSHGKDNKAKGLEAKKREITLNCELFGDKESNFLDLEKFHKIENIECLNENECKNFHRLLNVILKRYYIPVFGGVRLHRMTPKAISKMFRIILDLSRSKSFNIIHIMEMIDERFCRKEDVKGGEVYLIDNVETIKIGESKNAQLRFEGLVKNGELNPNAKLKVVYTVDDKCGFEAKAQAILNQYKSQNPRKAKGRNASWGALDEHFSCDIEKAVKEIEINLKGQYKEKTLY